MQCAQYGGSSANSMEERFQGYSCGTSLIEHRIPIFIVLGTGSSRLYIQRVALEDGGEFVCQAQTDQGMKEVKHQVIFQGVI